MSALRALIAFFTPCRFYEPTTTEWAIALKRSGYEGGPHAGRYAPPWAYGQPAPLIRRVARV